MKAPFSGAGRRLLLVGGALALMLLSWPAAAKDYGVHTPSGRRIYKDDEAFGDVSNTRLRRFVVEAAVGAGPEGNVAALVGLLNWPIRRLGVYAGFGLELNPARHYTAALRYDFNLKGYRPYVAAGYLYNHVYRLGTFTHDVFAETGYTWVLHDTYRLSLGVGVRYRTYLGIMDSSPLNGEHIDRDLLAAERDDVFPWVPTLALRFSRAF